MLCGFVQLQQFLYDNTATTVKESAPHDSALD